MGNIAGNRDTATNKLPQAGKDWTQLRPPSLRSNGSELDSGFPPLAGMLGPAVKEVPENEKL